MSDDLPPPDTEFYAQPGDFASRFFVDPKTAVRVRFGSASDTGLVRENNEDHFAVLHRYRSQNMLSTNLPREKFSAIRDEAFAFVVTDGLGGAAAGEMASRVVMEEAWELSAQASSWVMQFHNLSSQQLRERLESYALRMQQKLVQISERYPNTKGMGTTWTTAYIMGWDAVIAHIGDSRAYIFRDGKLKQLTRDHTLAQAMKDSGMTPGVADRFHHLLTNVLDSIGGETILDVEHVSLQHGDRLLLCTDGLSDMVPENKIVEIMGSVDEPRAACRALIAKALENGGKDNVTVVLGKFTDIE
ncbi:Serine/threonine phosphatase stp [Symmachiella macrocystis]|uniref:Serine/threonine phosphatase stp n=1 Tax=Symmachiella macrocystis TaxID=2527985 RepID=A0A5C6BB73_9PLAN|nr:protein phosphatase 2C domain-containing protein [Symmachiella macrocystis]TWU08922.1 Serine/threonine phosphatase stp [Symmachiella macrocystis]